MAAVRESRVTTDAVSLGAPTVAPRSRPRIAVEAMVFGKVESVDKFKTPYNWGSEACSRLAPVSELAGSCGLPRDGLPTVTMRMA